MGAIIAALLRLLEMLTSLDAVIKLWNRIRTGMGWKPKRKPVRKVRRPKEKKMESNNPTPALADLPVPEPTPESEPVPEPAAIPEPEKPKWGRPADKRQAVDMYRGLLERCADGIPLPLLFAVCWQESSFNPEAYRYEPNYDFNYIRVRKTIRLDMPPYKDFLCEGITIDRWFSENPKRSATERVEGRDYSFPAQLRVAASYGLMQLMYPTAVGVGHRSAPEDLFNPEVNVPLGVRVLKQKLVAYGGNDKDAVAAYNAGKARRNVDGTYRNQLHVDRVMGHREEFERILAAPPPEDVV